MGRTGTGTQVQKRNVIPRPPLFFQWHLWVLRSSDPFGPAQSRESLRELLSLAHLSPVLIIRVLSLLSALGCALRSPFVSSAVPPISRRRRVYTGPGL